MEKDKGVTIDKCVVGREYWLDKCMNESGIYAGNGKWIPTIRKRYVIDVDGLIKLMDGLFYPKNNSAKAELENKIRIPIPADHTAKIENNAVIFKPKTAKFKKGDFATKEVNGRLCMAIFDKDYGSAFYEVVGYVPRESAITFVDDRAFGNISDYRLATDSEKQILLDKLHEAGKDWDFRKKEIVDFVWKPEAGDSIWSINVKGLINEWTCRRGSFVPDPMDFRTRELAESALELLKQAKHY